MMIKANIAYSIVLLFFAGLVEVGGCYMIWQAAHGKRGVTYGIGGAALLVIYGLVAAQQPHTFGRTFAAYGGVFILLSLLLAWQHGEMRPDLYDVVGTLVILVGILILLFAPRASS